MFAIGASLALVLHAVFPRYEWRTSGESGTIVIGCDRWANDSQRAVYDERGKVTSMDPFNSS